MRQRDDGTADDPRAGGGDFGGVGEQVVVPVDGAAGLDRTASGEVADRLTEAFAAARAALLDLAPGGAVLLTCTADEDGAVLAEAVASLCRTLAREAAPRGVRVNALIAEPGARTDELVAFLGSAAGVMCTGTVLEAAR